MFILWKHILRAQVIPFLFSTIILMAIFILQFIMKFMDNLVGKGLSAGVIVEVVVFNLAWMLVLAIPMSVLVATLMAFGTLSANNEITAMRASGLSLYRLIAPALAASILLCFALIQFNNDILPDANHKAKVLSSDIYRKKPTLSIVPGLFSTGISGYTILVRKTFEESNDLEGVTIFDHTRSDVSTTVTAKRGTISFSPDYRKLIMDLWDGEIHEIGTSGFKHYRTIRFVKHRIAMDASGFDFQRSQESAFSRGQRELSAGDMWQRVDSLRKMLASSTTRTASLVNEELEKIFSPTSTPARQARLNRDPKTMGISRVTSLRSVLDSELRRSESWDRQIREFLVEIHKKYSIPVACIVFVLIGAPLGIMARRGTFGVAASLSLGFFLLYWSCLIGGEKLADRGFIQPWLGMWIANIILGALGLYLTIRTARESLTIDWSKFRRFIPRQWQSEEQTESGQ